MRERKNNMILAGAVLSVSLIAASLTALLLTHYNSRTHMQALGQLCQMIIDNQPEAEPTVLLALKEYRFAPDVLTDENILLQYGYRQSDFWQFSGAYGSFSVIFGFLSGGILFFTTFALWRRKDIRRIEELRDYLEEVNAGSSGVLLQGSEDHFSILQDEIYKTVTALYQTRETAIKAKDHFAENLSNIAHQLKTPITAISLSAQMMKEDSSTKIQEQILKQLSRLTHLEEALLLLARIDAGTLSLKREEVDPVFKILTLASENVQELFSNASVSVEIPESGEVLIYADMDWTMEAVMNLFKNCMEHTPPGGTVYCSYEQNPLYAQIFIWDAGVGFAKEDIPHLFERFYRGKNSGSDGIGIGLALSKEIIEKQGGILSARNLPEGGACFEIRFYSH